MCLVVADIWAPVVVLLYIRASNDCERHHSGDFVPLVGETQIRDSKACIRHPSAAIEPPDDGIS